MNNQLARAWIDFQLVLILSFVILLIIAAEAIHKKTQDVAGIAAPGNVIVEISWPPEDDSDVDLWVRAPGDKPVGYSSKSGTIFNLLRDDLGKRGDDSNLNYEVAYARGAPAGEYVVNVHLYRSGGAPLPIAVLCIIRLESSATDNPMVVGEKTIQLRVDGQETTVIRFSLDAQSRLVPGSINDLPVPLRVGLQ